MRYLLATILSLGCLMAADATGKWSGTFTVNQDGEERARPALLVLKQEGNTLSGTAGPDANEQHAITNGKVQDGTLTFDLPTDDATMRFVLKLEGNEITGEISRDHEGQKQTAKLAVKREQ